MSRRVRTFWAILTSVAMSAGGGCTPSQPFYFFEDGDLLHYKGVATDIDYPDVETVSLAEVEGALEPFTLSNFEEREIWNLTLQEAMQNALANGKVMRTLGAGLFTPGLPAANQNLPPTGQLLNAPGATPTVYNPAIVESDPRFGTEAALAEFDTQFSSSMFWEKNDRPVNLFFRGFLSPILEQDLGTFRAELAKRSATGTQLGIRHNTTYDWNNNPSNQFPSAYNNDIEAEFRHPLLQGGGLAFNRIAGPNSIPGIYNGVVIARINTDIALADFEGDVRDFVADVERSYWDLYFNYRNLDAVLAGRDSALETWRRVFALYQQGARGGGAADEAQAREQFFLFRSQVENALSNLYTAENRLRFMMGLSPTDGRLIRPADEPSTAQVRFDWHEILPESLTRSVEVRRQKWSIKQRELQLTASRNFLLPRLDAVARYRWRGFGDDLIRSDPSAAQFDNAWQELTGGDFQEWQLGFNFSMPLGFRQELAAVRNAELQLARERALLQDQELELVHQLSNAIRDLDRNYVLSATNFNRRVAAEKQVEAVKVLYETQVITLDLLLDAQRRLADAEIAYYRSLVDYNVALLQVHFRKGSLLEYNGVYLAEGPWPAKAYFDARKRARERDAALFFDYGFTRPEVFSRGPFPQQMGQEEHWLDAAPSEPQPELVPTPAPTPAEPMPEAPGSIEATPDEESPSDAAAPGVQGSSGSLPSGPSLGGQARHPSAPIPISAGNPASRQHVVGGRAEIVVRQASHDEPKTRPKNHTPSPELRFPSSGNPSTGGWKSSSR